MYAYTIGCYAPGSREAYVADRQIRGLLPKQRLWAQYAQIPLCIISPSTIYTHWIQCMAAIIIDELGLGKSLGLFKPCE